MTELLDGRYLSFLAIATLIIITPGPDTVITVRNALAGGPGAAVATALGVITGTAFWLAAAVFGIALVIASWPPALTALRIGGAIYLTYLGISGLRVATRRSGQDESPVPVPRGAPFRQGLVSNLLNAKMGVFYLTVLPTFIRPGDSPLRLGSMVVVYELMVLLWLSAYGYVVSNAARAIGGIRFQRILEGTTGIVLIGIALVLIIE